MAKQVLLEELQGCKTYLGWLVDKLSELPDELDISSDMMNSEISRELCRLLFDMDFTWLDSVKDDEIRATDALEIRKIYAEDVGRSAGKSERDIDRIRKSIHGKTSVLELIFSLCGHLDGMVNEDAPGTMIGFFYRILVHNLRLDEFGDKDFLKWYPLGRTLEEAGKLKEKANKSTRELTEKYNKETLNINEETVRREEQVKEIWKARVKKWLERDYFESGCDGGMFPLYEWKDGDKDQRKLSLWYQMNAWLNEHLDDEERFVVEKSA